jgi:ribosome-binding ATPase YchF (GTP1/OBG family)
MSFFTAGEKDSHAWAVRKGATAWEAAGCIHSDIQKGFIRAEVMSYADLMSAGGFNQARANNKLRLENKEYIVQDGDLINFRFNK